MGEEHYKFKWSNVDMADFIEQRNFAARKLREEARILICRAEQIEEETHIWENALVEPET